MTTVVADTPVPGSRRVVTTYYALAGVYTLAASVIWGVNTLFLLDAGLSFFEVFVANAAYSVGTVLFEIPTGVVADTLGRRASFLASAVVLALVTVLYLALAEMGAGVVPFALVSVLMGLGFTFYSGAVEAWLVDALDASGFRGALDSVFARGQQVTGAAMLLGTVGGGLLGQIDLSAPYVLRSALLVLVFAIAFVAMHDIGFTPRRVASSQLPAAMTATARAGVAFGWAQRPVRLLMVVAAIQTGFVMWAFYAWQPYLLELLGRDAVWVAGLVSAGIACSTIAGNQVVGIAARYCGRRTTLLLVAVGFQAAAAILVGVATSFWVAVLGLFGIMGALGVTGPVRQAYIQQLIPSEQRATVTSFDSMVAGVGGTGGQLGLGALGEARSVPAAFVVGGLATAAAIPLVARLRMLGGSADRFAGAKAGVECGCAHGLPAVATVDAQAVEDLEARPSVAA
ncbi:MAG TPA: MFS transporter [Gaiellaceae bacterium]|nr:MFS transporter [Gaiellaceae bacterium]